MWDNWVSIKSSTYSSAYAIAEAEKFYEFKINIKKIA